MPPLRSSLVAFLCVAIAGCSAVGPGPSTGRPSSAVSPSADGLVAARASLDHALERLEAIHPEPFHAIGRSAFVAELESLKDRLGGLTPDQAMTELMRVWALLATERDGHQFALPIAGPADTVLPIRVYEFEEGLFITAAMEPNGDLVGSRIISIGARPIEEVLDALEPLVPRDGPATVASFRPIYLLRPGVLRGLGLIGPGKVSVTLDGDRTVLLEPIGVEQFEAWAGWLAYTGLPPMDGLRHTTLRTEPFSVELLPDGTTVYVRYHRVGDISAQQVEELRTLSAGANVERVLVDLRQNPGGDNHNYPPLLDALRHEAIDQPGRLVVLTDRITFSAASNFSTEIEQSTSARFVGEPMGGGLNFWNDVDWVELPDYPVPMRVAVSTRYWQKAPADDPRLSIAPDAPVAVRAADYFAGLDPALEAALAP